MNPALAALYGLNKTASEANAGAEVDLTQISALDFLAAAQEEQAAETEGQELDLENLDLKNMSAQDLVDLAESLNAAEEQEDITKVAGSEEGQAYIMMGRLMARGFNEEITKTASEEIEESDELIDISEMNAQELVDALESGEYELVEPEEVEKIAGARMEAFRAAAGRGRAAAAGYAGRGRAAASEAAGKVGKWMKAPSGTYKELRNAPRATLVAGKSGQMGRAEAAFETAKKHKSQAAAGAAGAASLTGGSAFALRRAMGGKKSSKGKR